MAQIEVFQIVTLLNGKRLNGELLSGELLNGALRAALTEFLKNWIKYIFDISLIRNILPFIASTPFAYMNTHANTIDQKCGVSKECNCPEYKSLTQLQFDQLKLYPNPETSIITCQKCFCYQSVTKKNLIPLDPTLFVEHICVQCHKKFMRNNQTIISCDPCTRYPCGSFYTPVF